MIAGEFDLSVGSIIGCAGMTIMLLTRHYEWGGWAARAAAGGLGRAIGRGNGGRVVRAGLCPLFRCVCGKGLRPLPPRKRISLTVPYLA